MTLLRFVRTWTISLICATPIPQHEKAGIDIIREWFAQRTSPSTSDRRKTGIEIVRDFMNLERGEENGWPASDIGSATDPRNNSSDEDGTHRKRAGLWRSRNLRGTTSPENVATEYYQYHETSQTPPDHPQHSHREEQPNAATDTPCKFFFSPVGCRFGPDCRFSHEPMLPQADYSGFPQPNFNNYPVSICPFFVAGTCRYGQNCAYAHIDPMAADQEWPESDVWDDQERDEDCDAIEEYTAADKDCNSNVVDDSDYCDERMYSSSSARGTASSTIDSRRSDYQSDIGKIPSTTRT